MSSIRLPSTSVALPASNTTHAQQSVAFEHKVVEDADLDQLMGSVPELFNITLGYLYDMPKVSYAEQSTHTFFGNISILLAAETTQAAYHILNGLPAEVKAAVDKNPAILSCEVEVKKDNIWARGTLLHIADMLGDTNLTLKKPDEEKAVIDPGIVEMLESYLPEEVRRERRQGHPTSWKTDTDARMKPYKDALETFAKVLIKAKATQFNAVKVECKDDIEKLRVALTSPPKEPITSGYIFDPHMLPAVHKLFEDNAKAFGGRYSDKADIFCIHAIALVYQCAAARERQVIKKGSYHVIENGQAPDRVVVDSSRWDVDFYIDIFGGGMVRGRWEGGGGSAASFLESLCRAKTAALQSLCNVQTISRSGPA